MYLSLIIVSIVFLIFLGLPFFKNLYSEDVTKKRRRVIRVKKINPLIVLLPLLSWISFVKIARIKNSIINEYPQLYFIVIGIIAFCYTIYEFKKSKDPDQHS